ncbi:MAG: hypothetical protein Q4F53_06430 [Nesterenkonia sp.]|uniref:hypothetical protein n=1 Tax=Nesterenkonia marinintestina TaxID=2979865 RepID=UPI0021BEF6CA|nr:hypothetical protein [Nesterenkonia sp. GX14115]MDO5493233.1 hypothetical protein [Nesterenkonia sp.]
MTPCATCGNEYEKAFTVTQAGETLTFDSFQCAIHRMAPTCAACGCRVIGHGVDRGEKTYCCPHCAGE